MSANLFKDSVVLVRRPAWHGMGIVLEEGVEAVEAFRLYGQYDITKEPLYFGDGTPSGKAALVRDPVPEDPVKRVFNVVSENYEHITPLEFAETWDASAGLLIETLGAIGKGEKMFITAKLGKVDVAGDEMDNYLFALADWGGGAMHVMLTPVRVVCQNTVVMGFSQAITRIGIVHVQGARERLADALANMSGKARVQTQKMADAFERMARKKIDEKTALEVLNQVYEPYRLEDYPEHRWYYYEDRNERIASARDLAWQLFNGAMTGYNQATAGTAWGLFQAVVEVENYGVDFRKVSTRDAQTLIGERAKFMARAYDVLMG